VSTITRVIHKVKLEKLQTITNLPYYSKPIYLVDLCIIEALKDALLLYDVLLSKVWRKEPKTAQEALLAKKFVYVNLSQASMAKHLTISVRRVNDRMRILKLLGWVEVVPKNNGIGAFYVLGKKEPSLLNSKKENLYIYQWIVSLWTYLGAKAARELGLDEAINPMKMPKEWVYQNAMRRVGKQIPTRKKYTKFGIEGDEGEESCTLNDGVHCVHKDSKKQELSHSSGESIGSKSSSFCCADGQRCLSVDDKYVHRCTTKSSIRIDKENKIDKVKKEKEIGEPSATPLAGAPPVAPISSPGSLGKDPRDEFAVNSLSKINAQPACRPDSTISTKGSGKRYSKGELESFRATKAAAQRDAAEHSETQDRAARNRQGKGPSVKVYERVWQQNYKEAIGGAQGLWGAKERGQMRNLLDKYQGDSEVVLNSIRFVIRNWKKINERYLRNKGSVPTIGFLLKFSGTLVPESEKWIEFYKVDQERKMYLNANPSKRRAPRGLESKWGTLLNHMVEIGLH
jgi:hypothetical protein